MWRSVLDLCINARMIGWGVEGDVAVGSAEPVDKSSLRDRVGRDSSNAASESDDNAHTTINLDTSPRAITRDTPVKMGRHIPPVPTTRRTRTQAIVRHLYCGVTNLWLLDALLAVQRLLGPTTLGNPHGMPGALHTFSHTNTLAVLPHVPSLSFVVPPRAVEMGIVAGLATGLSAGVSGVYHLFAVGALALGWEVESWEPDMMDSPLMGTSLLDVWGRRWHQLFRVSSLQRHV